MAVSGLGDTRGLDGSSTFCDGVGDAQSVCVCAPRGAL